MLNVTTPIDRSRACHRRSTSATTAAASTGLVRSAPLSTPAPRPVRRNVPATRVNVTPVSWDCAGWAGKLDSRFS